MSSYTCQVLCGCYSYISFFLVVLWRTHYFPDSSDEIIRHRGAKWAVEMLNHLSIHQSTYTTMNCPSPLPMSLMPYLRNFATLFLIYVMGVVNMYFIFLQNVLVMQGNKGIIDLEVHPPHQTDSLLKNSRQIRIWAVSTNLQSWRFHITSLPRFHWLIVLCTLLATRKFFIISGWSPFDCYAKPFPLAFFSVKKEPLDTIHSIKTPPQQNKTPPVWTWELKSDIFNWEEV